MRNLTTVILACVLGAFSFAAPGATEAPYSFTLPDGWRDISDPDVIAYESRDKSQQLTVSEYVLSKKLSMAELRTVLERFIETRRKAETELSGGEATVGDPSYLAEPSQIKAEYWGSRRSSQFHSATIVWATSNRVVSWRFESTDVAALKETVSRVKPTIKVN